MGKTIKVIDLLNKIADKEELPNKILIRGYEYHLAKDYRSSYFGNRSNINFAYEDENENYWLDMSGVNEELEIIEEDKEIEEIEFDEIDEMTDYDIYSYPGCSDDSKENFKNKINELIRNQKKIINELKKGK